MSQQKTHQEVKSPQISARFLADYMAASETAKRTIVRGCKYQPIARLIQHDEAKLIVAKFFREGKGDLMGAAQGLRDRMADTDFDRDLIDHNADYIERFAKVYPDLVLPNADLLTPGNPSAVEMGGVRVTVEIHFRLQRLTKTNKVRVGAASLRYAKGKALPAPVGEWQSAFLFGYLTRTSTIPNASPEHKLCLTVDAYAGECHPAPTDSVRRFKNMESACASIADRWPNVAPPVNAAL